jgi:hypothetical protein
MYNMIMWNVGLNRGGDALGGENIGSLFGVLDSFVILVLFSN